MSNQGSFAAARSAMAQVCRAEPSAGTPIARARGLIPLRDGPRANYAHADPTRHEHGRQGLRVGNDKGLGCAGPDN